MTDCRLLFDDLDTIGHSPKNIYVNSESKRIENVHKRLAEIDIEIGKTIDILKQKGIYNSTYTNAKCRIGWNC